MQTFVIGRAFMSVYSAITIALLILAVVLVVIIFKKDKENKKNKTDETTVSEDDRLSSL